MRFPSWTRAAMLAVAVAVISLLALSRWLDDRAAETVSTGLKRALVSFAVARTANAAISVLQEVTVSGGAVIVSGSIQPFQFLDPLNDLVEQFSTLMLAASISFGIQHLLLAIGSHAAVSWLLVAVAVLAAVLSLRAQPLLPWLPRVLGLLLFVRFAVPVAAIGSEVAFTHFMQPEYQQAQAGVESGAAVLDRSTPSDAKSSLEAMQGLGSGLKARAEALVTHVVTLMAIFLLQTVILPLAFLWLAWRVVRWTITPRAP